MSRLQSLLINPVLNKEIKLRFRSFKNFLGIFLFLAICGAVCLAFIYTETQFSYDGFTAEDSKNLFLLLSMGQLGLIVFITPGLTAGAISGEREKQTLNIMLTTQQSSTSIILSKLFSSLLYLILMLVASLPLYSIVFLYGGVSPQTVLIMFGYLFLTMLAIGSIGIMFSTLIKRTIISTITTYGTMLFLVVGTVILFLIIIRLIVGFSQGTTGGPQSTDHILPYIVLVLNPAVSMLFSLETNSLVYEFQQIGVDWPFWVGFTIAYGAITLITLLIAIKKLRPSMRRKKKG
ncbi:ABC-type transport system involved in multi-copper enzyme maturation, permease component [Gracilibacillus ureilyticus]|uniref:ABC-type transport system involved in multi-copper enzyme maturation, permease component n=1 Tax=Gracilibacillus ureilyticus TaxID=531814 RepID=A0A1H9TWQ9_9BACI|nr:ABC transporter permease [Gracilibacillus ureilyticus]SES01665.1 ABC-type transport system involved in multi-copper enzyme maturation, permease component [Gracilibacillus ureilyticus]